MSILQSVGRLRASFLANFALTVTTWRNGGILRLKLRGTACAPTDGYRAYWKVRLRHHVARFRAIMISWCDHVQNPTIIFNKYWHLNFGKDDRWCTIILCPDSTLRPLIEPFLSSLPTNSTLSFNISVTFNTFIQHWWRIQQYSTLFNIIQHYSTV